MTMLPKQDIFNKFSIRVNVFHQIYHSSCSFYFKITLISQIWRENLQLLLDVCLRSNIFCKEIYIKHFQLEGVKCFIYFVVLNKILYQIAYNTFIIKCFKKKLFLYILWLQRTQSFHSLELIMLNIFRCHIECDTSCHCCSVHV